MSNAQAPATVTAAITTLVQMAVDHAGITPGPVVSPGSLEDVGDNARVSVHLYRVSRNAALSGTRLPTRTSGGDLVARPQVALDLHYLLAFRGNDDFEAQTMLAITAATLATTTTVSRDLLERTEDDHAEVLGNDLREAPEPVRICSEELGLDDLNRLWSLYSSGAFAPTLAVVAGPVLVESSAVPGSGLPVLRYGLRAAPTAAPRLDVVSGPLGPGAPVRAAAPMPDLHLRGAALGARAGETVEVQLDGVAAASVTTVDDGHLVVTSPPLPPGTRRVQVRRVGPPIDPTLSTTPVVLTSEVRPVRVLPTITGLSRTTSGSAAARSGTVTAAVVPLVRAGQRVRLLLDGATTPPVNAALDAPALPTAPTASVAFTFEDLPAGTYRVTLEVDGARSMPPVDAGGHYDLQEVTL